ncbi:toprim domain-containing protein [Acidithiobacillus sulfurivorans]|uniref:Toprim domain-containing protein n=1 Tax=Acidithiobacillus sulfurivorans TaxID=1958756 RepID=A0ABS5ZWB9_9PROT|nr:toprim domain-containing protein [Acidithiobacillus sulfurivorans]MBU2759521.1 hypothetical protein [Acidithiobacillus sulfurivorans]
MVTRQTKTPAATGAHNKTPYGLHNLKTLTSGQEVIAAFTEAMRDAGVAPASPSALVADGLLHRHHIEGDRPGTLNGWHVLHLDSPASGAAGNWRTGAKRTWCSKRLSALTASERAEIRRITEDRKRAQEAIEGRHRAAAERAVRIWAASAPAAALHPYLQRKGIAPGVARQSGAALVLPVQDFTGKLWGLQFIHPDGSKRFLPGMSKAGHFIPTGEIPDGTRPLWITEGWATSSTLAAMKPDACHVAACDAGNLAAVAQAARAKWPGLELVICPDFDTIGREKAQQAAISARCLILPPPAVVPPHCSDWNDWRQGVAS